MAIQTHVSPDKFTSFGELLKYLRRRSGLTQRDLSMAVGYSEGQISRLEQNKRLPDLATVTARFVEALDVKGDPAIVDRLLELAVATRREEAAPQASHNLPLQLTSFIGREKEVTDVRNLLAVNRLVTLTGPGGVGKTRLALQVAAGIVDELPDGVCWVELASILDPALVPQAVESMLDVREEPGYRTLADHLRHKSLLLILDNCEHVVVACSQLAEALLRTCPGLTIMTTSREGLGIAGEVSLVVASLALPDERRLPSLDTLLEYEAVRLFIERAATILPGFTANQDNAAAIAQVCHRLDGIPLAIELAAARVKMLTVPQIAERLDNRFRLLTGGSRTAMPRHQTLSALISWSFELLFEAERALFQRLSVFSGGFTLEAAEIVCADEQGNLSPGMVLDLLSQLVSKSLVVADRAGGESRYRMLETIRQYASEKLIESGEGEHVRNRHLGFFVRWAETAEPDLRGRNQLEWFNRIETEHDNLRVALAWSLKPALSAPEGSGPADTDSGQRLAGAMAWFWYVRGYWGEARAWLEGALASGAGGQPAAVKVLCELANLAFCQGDNARASALFEESLNLCRKIGDKRSLAFALANQADYLNWMHNDFGPAEALLAESLALYRELGQPGQWGYARALTFLGEAALFQDGYPRAATLFAEGLTLFRELEDRWGMSFALENLGVVAWRQSDRERAILLLEESLALAREMGIKYGIGKALHRLGRIRQITQRRGDRTRSESLLRESLTLAREMEHRWGMLQSLWGLALSSGLRGQPERQACLLGAMETVRQALGYPMPPADKADYETAVSDSRDRLDEEAFAAAWAEGQAMSLEEAITYALQESPL